VARAAIGSEGLAGPAIILEETATTYLDAGYTARLLAEGALAITDDSTEA
jgi:hypothetical protein